MACDMTDANAEPDPAIPIFAILAKVKIQSHEVRCLFLQILTFVMMTVADEHQGRHTDPS
jgi:hypothetical protein